MGVGGGIERRRFRTGIAAGCDHHDALGGDRRDAAFDQRVLRAGKAHIDDLRAMGDGVVEALQHDERRAFGAVLYTAVAEPSGDGPTPTVELGDLAVDFGRARGPSSGAPVALTTREFDLLGYLATHPGLALSRRQLLDGVWGDDWFGDERTVDVHVRQLRKKLGGSLPLATVWGVGYRLG